MAVIPTPDQTAADGGYIVADTSAAVVVRMYDDGTNPPTWYVKLINSAWSERAVRGPFGNEADAVTACDALAAVLGTIIT